MKTNPHLHARLLVLFMLTCATSLAAQVLPKPQPPFKGHIGLSYKDSIPDFPQPVHASQGAPNILLVLLDDVGYGASSMFGGPINTPTLERLAREGLKYTNFHTTALCSPTRAALITGRNHHSVHSGVIIEAATGYPGYDSLIGRDTATVAEVLRQNAGTLHGLANNIMFPIGSQATPDHSICGPRGLALNTFMGSSVEIRTSGDRMCMRVLIRSNLTSTIRTIISTMISPTKRSDI